MNNPFQAPFELDHHHVFLGDGHDTNERKTWAVIVLCSVMMLAEIVGGHLFGSLALVADGMHMSTHAGAMLIAALAYTYARKYVNDTRFVFGTGKLGDLAGFSSAIILAMVALFIGYEAIVRLLSPVPISYSEAIPIAVVGLLVNIASAWLLSGGDHHGHSHGHAGGHDHGTHDYGYEAHIIKTPAGGFVLSIFEDGIPPVFRIHTEATGVPLPSIEITLTTVRPDGTHQLFSFAKKSDFLESTTAIPEPHAFEAQLALAQNVHSVVFEEHAHQSESDGIDRRDHNMRAAYIHVIADAAVSVLAIIGLLLAKSFGWLWMDPLAGLVGAFVIANWSYGLIRDTGANLMDISPDDVLPGKVRAMIASVGDKIIDLHVWRLGPGHFGVVVSIVTGEPTHGPSFYQPLLRQVTGLSHITVEVHTRSEI